MAQRLFDKSQIDWELLAVAVIKALDRRFQGKPNQEQCIREALRAKLLVREGKLLGDAEPGQYMEIVCSSLDAFEHIQISGLQLPLLLVPSSNTEHTLIYSDSVAIEDRRRGDS